jgi:hypothetical protein
LCVCDHIIILVNTSQKTAVEFNIFNTIKDSVFFFFLSCFCALALALVVEFPMINIDKLLFRQPQNRPDYKPLATEDPDTKKSILEDN